MKKLHIFLLKSYLGPLVLTFFIVLFLLLMQFLWKYIDDLVGKGLEIKVIAELLMYTSTSLIPLALPLAILLSALMTFGNLGENYELTAIKSAGISLQRLMVPLIVLVVMLSVGAFFFSNIVLPNSNLKMRSLIYDIQQQRPELQIKPGKFSNQIDGYGILIGGKDPNTNLLKDLLIYDHTERKGNTKVTRADSGYMRMTTDQTKLLLTLYNGWNYNEVTEDQKRNRDRSYPHRREKFAEQNVVISLSGFELKRTDQNLFKNNYQMMNLGQLSMVEDSLKNEYKQNLEVFKKNVLESNYYKRYSFYSAKSDTTQKVDTLRSVNIDSIYSTLNTEQKKRALNQAKTLAQTSKSLIVTNAMGLKDKLKTLRKHQIEWHRKFTLSVACFVFFFIGAPLGAIIRKGGLGLPVIISILFFIIYYVISLSAEKFVRESMLLPEYGMWLSSAILFPAGVFLTYKATTDAAMLNMDTYTKFVNRIAKVLRFTNENSVPNK